MYINTDTQRPFDLQQTDISKEDTTMISSCPITADDGTMQMELNNDIQSLLNLCRLSKQE